MSENLKVLFLGSKELGLKVLKEIHSLAPESLLGAVTIDDRSDVRTNYEQFLKFAEDENINLETALNRRHSEELVAEFSPDLCLVVGWYWLIGTQTLESVPHGFVGVHNSLLPKYRGSSPLVWTMINGEKEAGFSLFSLTEKMDEGDVWASGKVPIAETDYVSDVLNKLEIKTLETIRSVYPRLLDKSAAAVRQNQEGATYCSPRFEFDGEINWKKPAREVYNFIRAQSKPYPGAFTFYKGGKLTIWKASLNPEIYFGTHGQVARVFDGKTLVVCGDSKSIWLETVEFDGQIKKAGEIVKSVKIRL